MPQGTPSPSATSGPPQDTSGASDAIQRLGLNTYPKIYAGGKVNSDGSIVIYPGPGDDTAFLNALHALMASPKVQAFGPEPAISITRVPHSEADFDAAIKAFLAAAPQLQKKGFLVSHTDPNRVAGTLDVFFTTIPPGMTAAAATTELQQTVSPLIRVTSVDTPQVELDADRQHDGTSPVHGSDLIHAQLNSTTMAWCTSGFTIIGTAGEPRGSTAAHCNAGASGNQTYLNGHYRVSGCCPGSPWPPTPDDTTAHTFGTTSNWQLSGVGQSLPGADIQLLDRSGDPYVPSIWVGQDTSAPQLKPVGAPYTSHPMPGPGSLLTFDGARNREHRWLGVTNYGSSECVDLADDGYNVLVCDLIQTTLYSAYQDQWPGPASQPGDSGGPVFCYACYSNGKVKPAGLIEGHDKGPNATHAYATWIGADLNAIGGGARIDTAP